MSNKLRELAERAIIENMDDEKACASIIAMAVTQRIFTAAEAESIREDLRRWNAKEEIKKETNTPEQLRMSKALRAEYGMYPALCLSLLIKQLPYSMINEDRWMVPDEKAICKALNIKTDMYVTIRNKLRDMNVIEKRVNTKLKKLSIRINFEELQRVYDAYVESDTTDHGDSLEV